ncbi:Transcriptional regulatory protein FixJ [Rubripirellula amarantea]|uniref:Transcriptional regulatory protein FixJ n=1 Tax=Rubripirellula amarantea TaxID=2527999 RepID=A0A5C5WE64_9BACT|nr:PAS domain S-box protein [Rubripirellula amarantea]TWT49266.1 Transcriptional regulatory protein FixJ [Rubripirellula amarantea]
MAKKRTQPSSSASRSRSGDASLCQLGFGDHLDEFGIGCICIDTTSLLIRDSNSSFLGLLQLQAVDVIGSPFLKLLQQDDRQQFANDMQVVCRVQGSSITRDYSVTRKDGTTASMQFTFVYGPLAKNDSDTVSATVTDVTAQRRAEAQLALSKERFELAQQHTKMGSWELVLGEARGWWSKELYELHRMTPTAQAPSVKDFMLRIHPEDREYVAEIVKSIEEPNVTLTFTYRSDPSLGPIRVFASCVDITIRDGKQVLNGTTQDITERQQLIEALQRSEHQYRRLLETAGEGFCYVSSDGVFTGANEAAANMLGYTTEELIGKNIYDMHSIESPKTTSEILSRRARGIGDVYERKLKHRDGHDVWVLVSSTPTHDDNGVFEGVRATLIDITDRKKLEAIAKNSAVANARLEMLTRREKDVLKHVVAGRMNKVIAKKLDLSEKSVERHRSNLMKKLHVQSVAELVRISVIAEAWTKDDRPF